jgi:hypothetical protein
LIVTIHQPEHLPWLGLFHKIDKADLFVLLDVVQFRKNYFQNRNRILGPNGPLWLTVPVMMKGHTVATIETTLINNQVDWQKKHSKTIAACYGRHPNTDCVIPRIEEIYTREWTYIADLNEALIREFMAILGISTPAVRASELGVTGNGSDLLLNITRRVNADVYLSGPSGRDYLDESLFDVAGIQVRYEEFHHPIYPQHQRSDFSSHLSTLDLLCNCGPDSLSIIRSSSGDK